jgi:hypothetical protein
MTVNTIMPGSTKSEGVLDLVPKLFPNTSPEKAEKRFMRENRPTSLIERLLKPQEITDFVTTVSPSRLTSTGPLRPTPPETRRATSSHQGDAPEHRN